MCGLIVAPDHYSDFEMGLALQQMGYRGQDDMRGLVSEYGWKLGHVRLAIRDFSTEGAQPFYGPHGPMAFVGELFSTRGKTEKEYLLNLYNSGEFERVDGFWSLVGITKAGPWLMTDHLGIKPLYVWPEKGIICSELSPMFILEPAPPLDEVYLSNCIKFGYDYSGRTAYQGIHQVAPGTRAILKDGQCRSEVYWDWNLVEGDPAELRGLIREAVHNRLISDRPVALLLSGGLDSSIIYYTLEEMGRDIEAFSVENGESKFLPPEVQPLKLEPVDMRQSMRIMQAPLDLGSLLPQIQLAQAVKAQGYNVVLTGDGADELFGGYRRAAEYDSQHSDVFCELPYYHLPRLDRVMMRSTIELRSPFLAPSVVAAALRTPRAERTSKQALKEAFRGLVPDRILAREKLPLKSPEVISGGLHYRQQLVEEFRRVSSSL